MQKNIIRSGLLFSSIGFFLIASSLSLEAANPAGHLRIEVLTAYNFVVDSNVETPASYGPRSAFLGAKYYNDGTNPLTDVYAFIGDFKGGTNDTPGIYPSRAQPPLVGPLPGQEFALTHEGGLLGTSDAKRNLGTIQPGEYAVVYWLVSYPVLDETGKTVAGTVKPDDDLWLNYDVWGIAKDGATSVTSDVNNKVTMRNEISAMANKILPNTANKVPQEYQDLLAKYTPSWTNASDDGTPGTRIVTEGVWYDMGNIDDGFDNNGDLVPDRNLWLQPVGDPSIFDTSAFRLIKTHVLLVVKLNDGTEQVYDVTDQLYFENIPPNNIGAVGYVAYEFMVLKGGSESTLSPYQEAASGYDNEKFNGDYGAYLGYGTGLSSGESLLKMGKTANVPDVYPGSNITYSVTFTNLGSVSVGNPSAGLPLVLVDSVPSGTYYVAASATNNNSLPAGVGSYSVLYSTNNQGTWLTTEPVVASNVTHLQWWLSDALSTGAFGAVRFAVTVRNPYPLASPVISNLAAMTFGGTTPFEQATALTPVLGTNQLGDRVFEDNGSTTNFGNGIQDGGETGISNITVWLYSDLNANGSLDAGDPLVLSTSTDTNGYYLFSSLFDGRYLAVVDRTDPDLPYGYVATTSLVYSANLDAARVFWFGFIKGA